MLSCWLLLLLGGICYACLTNWLDCFLKPQIAMANSFLYFDLFHVRLWAHCLALYIISCSACVLLYFVRKWMIHILSISLLIDCICINLWPSCVYQCVKIINNTPFSPGIQKHHQDEASTHNNISSKSKSFYHSCPFNSIFGGRIIQ